MSHIHISDYHGVIKDWENVGEILQPLQDDIDWEMFFGEACKLLGTGITFTIESPSYLPNDIDIILFNHLYDKIIY